MTELAGFYSLTNGYAGFRDEGGVHVELSRLRRSRDGLQGEIVVSAAVVPRLNGRLHEAMFNVSSTVARDRLTKLLNDRSRPETLPWDSIIEEFCSRVLEAERQGAPVVSVGNGNSGFTRDLMLVDPLMPAGKTTIVFAQGGTGKSYLALLVSVAIRHGIDVLGWSTKQTGQVLYLDWEADADEVDMRIRRVAQGLGVNAPEILYRPMTRTLDDVADQIARVVEAQRVALVVVDSVQMASGASREHADAAESAIRLFSAFRTIGTTVLAIDHVTGEDARGERAVHKPYGSIFKVNLARSVWELRGTTDDKGDSHLALYHRKVNAGRLHEAMGFKVEHTADATTFTPEEVDDPSLVQGLSQSARIERLLRDGPMSVREIAHELGTSEGSARVVLNRGVGTLFVKEPDGTWDHA